MFVPKARVELANEFDSVKVATAKSPGPNIIADGDLEHHLEEMECLRSTTETQRPETHR